MKGKINNEGKLYIERAGVMKQQLCPNSFSEAVPYMCGDWCPMFGEPSREYMCTIMGQDCFSKNTTLTICNNKTITFTEFKDERVQV